MLQVCTLQIDRGEERSGHWEVVDSIEGIVSDPDRSESDA